MAVKTLTKTMIRMASNASNKDHRLLSRTTFWRSRDQCSALAKPAHWILLQRRNSITNPRSAPPAATQQTLQCMQDLLNRVKSSKSSNKMCVDRLTLATISLTMFQFKVPQGSPNTNSYSLRNSGINCSWKATVAWSASSAPLKWWILTSQSRLISTSFPRRLIVTESISLKLMSLDSSRLSTGMEMVKWATRSSLMLSKAPWATSADKSSLEFSRVLMWRKLAKLVYLILSPDSQLQVIPTSSHTNVLRVKSMKNFKRLLISTTRLLTPTTTLWLLRSLWTTLHMCLAQSTQMLSSNS